MAETLERACRAYLEKPLWFQLIETGMQQDWSWRHSAEEYAEVYQRTAKRGPVGIG
jgi:starch synthase